MLEEKILNDYQQALKEKDHSKVETLRFLRSILLNTAIEKKKKNLDDSEVIAVIRKQMKDIQEAMEEYKRGNRLDLAEKGAKELKILGAYLPAPLSEEELLKIIQEVIEIESASGIKDMGKVMKGVLAKVAGRADSKRVSELVKERLSLKK
jgi:uncharacterized protein YqeY